MALGRVGRRLQTCSPCPVAEYARIRSICGSLAGSSEARRMAQWRLIKRGAGCLTCEFGLPLADLAICPTGGSPYLRAIAPYGGSATWRLRVQRSPASLSTAAPNTYPSPDGDREGDGHVERASCAHSHLHRFRTAGKMPALLGSRPRRPRAGWATCPTSGSTGCLPLGSDVQYCARIMQFWRRFAKLLNELNGVQTDHGRLPHRNPFAKKNIRQSWRTVQRPPFPSVQLTIHVEPTFQVDSAAQGKLCRP